jgi:hypothetical protein
MAKSVSASTDDLIAYMGAEDGELFAPPIMQTGDFFGEHNLLGRCVDGFTPHVPFLAFLRPLPRTWYNLAVRSAP